MKSKNFINVKPEKSRLVNILEDIEKGEIRIPIFQRSLVWNEAQMKDLFDSIAKGYPIGSVLFWAPQEEYKCYETFGPYMTEIDGNADPKYVLDGCQRLVTLFGTLSNPRKFASSESEGAKKFAIYYNLKDEEFTYLKTKTNEAYLIPLYKIVDTFEYLDFLKKIEAKIDDNSERELLINNAKKISKILIDYEIPYTIIHNGDISSAVEIFSRVNSTGTDISEDWMLSALLYNTESNFLLSERISRFLNELERYNFSNLKRDTVLDCIASAVEDKVYFDVKVEDLAKRSKYLFENATNQTLDNIKRAINFLYNRLHVIDYKLLPYPSQLIFITEFFRINPSPSRDEETRLVNWFWITSYSNYFTIYSLSQQRKAYDIFKKFALGEHPDGIYKSDSTSEFTTQPFPREVNFGSVRSKTLQLFLLNVLSMGNIYMQEYESLKEQFLFYSKDKSAGNILLRLSSEFELSKEKRDVYYFVTQGDSLESYFISAEMKKDFKMTIDNLSRDVDVINFDEANVFISKRQMLIQDAEKKFVQTLGLRYIKNK